VAFAIQKPFDIDIRNRLLKRGRIEELSMKPNFFLVDSDLPILKPKTALTMSNQRYHVLEEIGRGSYAKTFLLLGTRDKLYYALKVSKF
jgi:hypothetical protein